MFRLFVASTAFAASIAGAANALVLTTDPSGYTGPQLDLSAYETGSYNFTFGPESLPNGITFTANPGGGGNSGMGSVIGQGGYGLTSNGNFGGDAVYIGVDSETGYAELMFDSPVSSFGGFWNYSPESGGDAPTIGGYDAMGMLLMEFDLSAVAPISTPGGFNEFAFRGLESNMADIKTVRFGGSYILLAATPEGAPAPMNPIPLPAGLPMLLGALGIFGLFTRSRARSA